MLHQIIQCQNLPSIIYGDGEQKRCFSYIDDCLYCLNALAFNDNVVGEVINIGPDEEPVTINELAEACANETGVNLDPIHHKDRPKEVKLATCSSDKARKLLNYKTSTNMRQSVKKTAEYIDNILSKVTLPGSIALALVAIFPYVLMQAMDVEYDLASFLFYSLIKNGRFSTLRSHEGLVSLPRPLKSIWRHMFSS